MRFGVEIETIAKQSPHVLANRSQEKIGVERVDTRNHYYHAHNGNKWGFESDGSIEPTPNYPHCVEIISPPLTIDRMGEIETILNTLKDDIQVNASCGLHVHVEIRDAETLRNICLIWRKFEFEIIRVFPESRRNNRYCLRLADMRTDDMLGLQFSRYHMVNPQSFAIRGTVEFRGHSGTVDYHKIKRWVLFCAHIVEVARQFHGRQADLGDCLNQRDLNMFEFLCVSRKTKNYIEGRKRHFEKRAQA